MMTTPAPTDFKNAIPVANAMLSAAASMTGTAVVVRSMFHTIVPRQLQGFLFSGIRGLLPRFSSEMTIVVDEYDGFVQNELFEVAQVFLAAKQCPSTTRIRVSKPAKENHFTLTMDRNQTLVDTFHGEELKWVCSSRQVNSGYQARHGCNSKAQYEVQYFELTFHEKHKEIVLNSYLPFVVSEAQSMKQGKRTLKIHTPSFNRSFGGKSSLVEAMANYLNFDIYDLELSRLHSNTDLKRLLVATANRSILVVEDIDCTIELQDRKSQTQAGRMNSMSTYYRRELTLSGFLNFIDGLWSSCGDEWIIVFTTNPKEKLDSAILRPGRMDVHVHMSYCTRCGFRLLACNYLGIDCHELLDQIESLIMAARVTPAKVAEQLMKSDEPEVALRDIVSFLANHKRKENEEVIEKKVCRYQPIEENEGTEEESGKSEQIEE
ncbi:hypothetical protein BT93_J1652 [Corymbia citriodora subsp. variegata]|nr:hypothetical protein BT93_J1652 [Corymbia citriodora subsp. variegata]